MDCLLLTSDVLHFLCGTFVQNLNYSMFFPHITVFGAAVQGNVS